MDHLEKENAKMGLEASEELTRITKIKACHILSEDQDYIKKVMFDSVKERKSEIIFLSFKISIERISHFLNKNHYIPFLRSQKNDQSNDQLQQLLDAIQN